ncbi:MAG TPA: hypothetical protein VLE70_19195 [Anaerolineae bacterium]|jgi:hypothetical protein|nr:hypothetical protein [Anaerolineae bacterium]
MKRRTVFFVTVLTIFLLVVISSVVLADRGAIHCDLDITYDDWGDGMYWYGTIDGPECSVAGNIRFDAVDTEYREPGRTLHFVENFTIWPFSDPNSMIKGKNCGVWNFMTLKYRAHGWVTEDTDAQWDHMVGYQYHEMGVTGDPSVLPVEAPGGSATLAPGGRPVDPPDNLCAPPEREG